MNAAKYKETLEDSVCKKNRELGGSLFSSNTERSKQRELRRNGFNDNEANVLERTGQSTHLDPNREFVAGLEKALEQFSKEEWSEIAASGCAGHSCPRRRHLSLIFTLCIFN